jgi:hypothetical protein
MSVKSTRRKCLCCRKAFTADYRNGHHQRYCSDPRCRRASHRASQQRWRRKPENVVLYRGEDEVRRVQEWRQKHPGYWKQRSQPAGAQPIDPEPVNPEQRSRNVPPADCSPLQDLCRRQDPMLVGLISLVTGSTLREDIDAILCQVVCKGQNILGPESSGTADRL